MPKPAAAKPSGKGDASRVFPADPLPTDGLKAVDARVRLKVKRLIVGGVSVNDVDIGVALGAGRLDIKPLAAVVSGGKIDASLVVDGSRAPLALSVNMDARGIDYGVLLKQLKITDIATGKFDAKLNVKGRGGSVRAIMAGLDGRARIVTQGGKIDSGILNVVSSDIMAALPFVDSKGDKEIRCGVIDFDIRKGRATAKTLIFETGGLSMIGTGSINLADESIDLKITPRAKKVSLLKLAMLPVNVGGTLASPSALPDIGGAAIGAASAFFGGERAAHSIGKSRFGIGRLLGGSKVQVGPVHNPQFYFILLDRGLLYVDSIIHWAHGRRSEGVFLSNESGEKRGYVSGFSEEERRCCSQHMKALRKGNRQELEGKRAAVQAMLVEVIQACSRR